MSTSPLRLPRRDDRFSGGFIGVDIFSVLSGCLVTQLLLRDIAGRGRIDPRRFHARRFRRLFPASFVALLVTASVFASIATPVEVEHTLGAFRAAFLYVADWRVIDRHRQARAPTSPSAIRRSTGWW